MTEKDNYTRPLPIYLLEWIAYFKQYSADVIVIHDTDKYRYDFMFSGKCVHVSDSIVATTHPDDTKDHMIWCIE